MARKKKSGIITTKQKAPEYLTDIAKSEWDRLQNIFIQEKLITNLDLLVIEGACVNYGIYRELYSTITYNGDRTIADYIIERGGNSQKQGELTTMNKAFDQYVKVLRMFGATPSARATMKIGIGGGDSKGNKEEDQMSKELDL